jgi:hypothetical protein
MKVKITTGKGFAGLVKYANKQDAEFVNSTTGDDPKAFLNRCAQLRESRPDVKSPVLHFSLSLPPGERLDDAGWKEAVARFQTDMGLQEHDFFAVRHNDTEHDHVHLIVSKIRPDGGLWKDGNSARRAIAACEKIEKDMSLTITKTLNEFRAESGKRRHQITDNELKMIARTGAPGNKRKEAIAKKIADQRRKQDEQKRLDGKDGITDGGGIDKRRSDQKTLHSNEGGDHPVKKASRKVGEIRSRRIGEAVHFKNDTGQLIARMEQDKIELFSVNAEAIEFAIKRAVQSGKMPLEIYGNDEFIKAATVQATAMGVPVKSNSTDELLRKLEAEAAAKAMEAAQRAADERVRSINQQEQENSPTPPHTHMRMN